MDSSRSSSEDVIGRRPAGIRCGRIFGLVMGRLWLRAKMVSRDTGGQSLKRGLSRPCVLSAWPGALSKLWAIAVITRSAPRGEAFLVTACS
jgi:hypothetical protein